MERVTFLIERTGARVSCLLNPESLEARRTAGLIRREGAGGAILGRPRSDDPVVAVGGGTTEFDLQLLFDVDVANEGRPPPRHQIDPVTGQVVSPADPALAPVIDVRSLTQPLWAMAENGEPIDGSLAPQRVRFIWGKSWNVPGVIVAVAERLERFDAAGVPQRSWLSLRLRRVEEGMESGRPPSSPTTPQFENVTDPILGGQAGDVVVATRGPDGLMNPRYDLLGFFKGDVTKGLTYVEANGFDNPLTMEEDVKPLVLVDPEKLPVRA